MLWWGKSGQPGQPRIRVHQYSLTPRHWSLNQRQHSWKLLLGDGSLSIKQEYWNESHLEWSTDKLTVWDAQYHLIFPWENEVLWELTRPCTVHIMSSEGRYLITNTISLSISLSIQKYLVYVPVGQDNPQFKMSGFSSPLNPRKMMSQGIDKLKAIAGLKKGIHGLSLVKSVI